MDKKRIQKLEEDTFGNLEKNLKKIYMNQEGNMESISHLDVKKNRWIKKILLIEILILFVLVGGIFLLIFLNKINPSNASSINIDFEIPPKLSSGEEVMLVLNYKNKEKFTLYDTDLSIRYPDNFEFIASDPAAANEFHDIWKLGDLVRGEEGKITLRGKIVGEVGSFAVFKGVVSYQPQNFSSIFKREFSSDTAQINSSILSVLVEGPQKIVPGQSTAYAVNFINTSNKDLEKIVLKAILPPNYILTSAKPDFTKSDIVDNILPEEDLELNQKIWYLEKLEKGKEGVVGISGKYDGANNDKSGIVFQIGLIENKKFIAYQEKKINFEIFNHGLKLDITLNGSKEETSVNFSDVLNYSISFKNIGSKTLYDAIISVRLASEALDWETLIDKNGGIRKNNVLEWQASTVPALLILKPLDEGNIDFSVRVKDLAKIKPDNSKDLTTNAIAEAIIGKIDDLKTNVRVSSELISAKLNTEMEMKVQGRYFDDDNIPVGQGPLPPIVGKKTVFRIYWSLSNNLHPAANVIVKTLLVSPVVWEDKFSSTVGTLIYNPADSSVSWKIPKISANKSFDDLQAWFDVSIIPKGDQAGKLLLLTAETSLTAKDESTNSGISQVVRGITTNLEDDPIGGGRGLVDTEYQNITPNKNLPTPADNSSGIDTSKIKWGD